MTIGSLVSCLIPGPVRDILRAGSGIIENMSERRVHRGVTRTDQQILAHDSDMKLIEEAGRGQLTSTAEIRPDLARLAREDVLLAGFGIGVKAVLLPRGARLLAAACGEHSLPAE